MTGIEIVLLLAGCVFMIGSFFVAEKLSPTELNKIAELSEGELRNIITKELKNANQKIEDTIEEQLESSVGKVERAMEQVSNEKIMAINEYSDTVIENMNKTHNEIMFLYNMLNDKHTELTGMTSELQRLAADVRSMQEQAASMQEMAASVVTAYAAPQRVNLQAPEQIITERSAEMPAEQEIPEKTDPEEMAAEMAKQERIEKENHNSEILRLHGEGVNDVEIARRLGLGLGEVKLVIGLYKGELHT